MINHKRLSTFGIETLNDFEAFLEQPNVQGLIGKNYDHYRELWLARYRYIVLKEPKQKVKGAFNWLGFLLPPVWLGYRRMYTILFILLAVVATLVFVEVYYAQGITPLIGLAVLFGFFGKDFYLEHVIKSAAKMNNHKNVDAFLKWHAGTSIMWASLALPISLALNIAAAITASYLSGNTLF